MVGAAAVGLGRIVGAGALGEGSDIVGSVGGSTVGEIAPGVLVWRKIGVSVGKTIGIAVNTGSVPRKFAMNAGGLLFTNPEIAT